MGKIMRVYLCGQEWAESREELMIDLPATPWELVDALEKLNLTSEKDIYTHVEECYANVKTCPSIYMFHHSGKRCQKIFIFPEIRRQGERYIKCLLCDGAKRAL